MERVLRYNHLFFTEESKQDPYNHNTTFWNKLSDFDRLHPDSGLIVFSDVKKDQYTGRYVEFLEFQCDHTSAYKQVQAIYEQHYHYLPLDLYSFLEREPTDEEIHRVECTSISQCLSSE